MRSNELTTAIMIALAFSMPGGAAAQTQQGDADDQTAPGEERIADQESEGDDQNDEDEEPEEASKSAADDAPATQPSHETPAKHHEQSEHVPRPEYGPALPEGMSLDDVLDIAAEPPAKDFPRPIPDDRLYVFLLGERLEYRARDTDGSGQAGLELQAWAGGDLDKIWLKTDADGVFVGETEVEAENDLLYSRLITPFWNLQAGAQYAFGWADDTYEDRWSAALALQGMAPGMLEVDASIYLSEALDLTGVLSAEYDVRVTQRLVLQPGADLGFSAQRIEDRGMGAGLTDMNLDARLRYEFTRKFSPYLGVRYRLLTFGTADFARDAGESPGTFFALAGLRFAI